MSVLDSFYEQFIARHDFEDSDIDIFINRWKKKATFKNIPLAWIIPLDSMMFELNKKEYIVKSVTQEYGQLVVIVPMDNNSLKAINIIEITRKKIEKIDEDLYSLFNVDIRKEFRNKRHNDMMSSFHENDMEKIN
jgi:hypothetical protein